MVESSHDKFQNIFLNLLYRYSLCCRYQVWVVSLLVCAETKLLGSFQYIICRRCSGKVTLLFSVVRILAMGDLDAGKYDGMKLKL